MTKFYFLFNENLRTWPAKLSSSFLREFKPKLAQKRPSNHPFPAPCLRSFATILLIVVALLLLLSEFYRASRNRNEGWTNEFSSKRCLEEASKKCIREITRITDWWKRLHNNANERKPQCFPRPNWKTDSIRLLDNLSLTGRRAGERGRDREREREALPEVWHCPAGIQRWSILLKALKASLWLSGWLTGWLEAATTPTTAAVGIGQTWKHVNISIAASFANNDDNSRLHPCNGGRALCALSPWTFCNRALFVHVRALLSHHSRHIVRCS